MKWTKTSLKVKQQRKPKFSTRAYTRCKNLRKTALCTEESTAFAVSASVELAYKGEIPGVKKASW